MTNRRVCRLSCSHCRLKIRPLRAMLSPLSATRYVCRSLHVSGGNWVAACLCFLNSDAQFRSGETLLWDPWERRQCDRYFSKNFNFVRGLCPLSNNIIPPVMDILLTGGWTRKKPQFQTGVLSPPIFHATKNDRTIKTKIYDTPMDCNKYHICMCP